jgi:hypothetical protein
MATVDVEFIGGPWDGEFVLMHTPLRHEYYVPIASPMAVTGEAVASVPAVRYSLAKAHRSGGWLYVLSTLARCATVRRWSMQ